MSSFDTADHNPPCLVNTEPAGGQSAGVSWVVLTPEEAGDRAAAHKARVEEFTARHIERRSHGDKHPVWDFLFDYYSIRPAQLQRWHPGVGVALTGRSEQSAWRDYRVVPRKVIDPHASVCAEDLVTAVDVAALWSRRGNAVEFIDRLFHATMDNPAHFDCFGLHEWAMVYRTENPRHSLPLRLGSAGTNEVVESHQIRCTHFDAFRFFTPDARPRNAQELTRETQPDCEQSGCLHATMDLLKWCLKLGPLVPGELLLDAFEVARQARQLDMEASPYDCRGLGFSVVAIETADGKAEYVRRQREIAQVGRELRTQLIAVVDTARRMATHGPASSTPGES